MYLKLLLSLILSVFTLSACSNSNNIQSIAQTSDSAFIINGTPVVASDLYAKHTVALGPSHEDQICTGVIIAPHFILSAGHCASDLKKGDIYFGLVATAKSTTVYKIKKITLHPDFCGSCLNVDGILTDANDLSIVEFEKDLPEGFEPVSLATFDQVQVNGTVYLAGFGADQKRNYDVLNVTHVLIKQIDTTEFKTSETKTGSCNGDSGGPAFIEQADKLILAGITSRGDEKCRKHGIYTIPAAHLEWINGVLNASQD